jgi:hypothetical protein
MTDRASILLATPAYGGLATIAYFRSVLALQRLCDEQEVGLEVELTGGDALITRARSRMITRFLQDTTHTHLLFVDADIGFQPAQALRLLRAGKDVIGGVYPLKGLDFDRLRAAAKADAPDLQAASLGYVVRFPPDPDRSVQVDDEGFGVVAYVGTGFMMISRQAAQRLADAHPELRVRMPDMAGSGGPAGQMVNLLFAEMIDPETGEHLSEDYAFCRRWQALGGEIWADFRTPMTHVGHAAYTGGLMAAVGASES